LSLKTRGRPRGSDLPVSAEINITSLVDVAFTLLVIFIITAPVLQGGIEVAVPRGQVSAISALDQPFIVTVERDGTVHVGETPVDIAAFEEAFPRLLQAANPEIVYIRGDSLALYGHLYRVISTTAQAEGIRWALVGEQVPAARR
jgi:biopolymer transport protein ExbD